MQKRPNGPNSMDVMAWLGASKSRRPPSPPAALEPQACLPIVDCVTGMPDGQPDWDGPLLTYYRNVLWFWQKRPLTAPRTTLNVYHNGHYGLWFAISCSTDAQLPMRRYNAAGDDPTPDNKCNLATGHER